uniref:Uncharacterized protein n=1 Tax=Lepeophtheirus salmonis TaxID=72036 RepID=A0A0K2V093_LEPSM
MNTFEIGKLSFDGCFRWDRVWITFFKPSFGLNSVFPIKKQR